MRFRQEVQAMLWQGRCRWRLIFSTLEALAVPGIELGTAATGLKDRDDLVVAVRIRNPSCRVYTQSAFVQVELAKARANDSRAW